MLQGLVLTLLEVIRPNAVGLVDAFHISDYVLCSALGRYDGDVYQVWNGDCPPRLRVSAGLTWWRAV